MSVPDKRYLPIITITITIIAVNSKYLAQFISTVVLSDISYNL